jgi:hypothetical protein
MCGLTDRMAQQAELGLDILYAVCNFQHKVPFINKESNEFLLKAK